MDRKDLNNKSIIIQIKVVHKQLKQTCLIGYTLGFLILNEVS